MNFDQRDYDKKPLTRSEAMTLYGAVFVVMLLFTLEIFTHYEPRKMAVLMFLLWWMPLVLLHEFGHALMARLLGWGIERTVVGFGRVVYEGRLFGAPLEVRMVPIEGFVRFQAAGEQGTRIKNALVYFAGPGIELLLFCIIALSLGWDNLFFIEDHYGKLALQSLAFAALAGAVINLIPMGVVTKDGESPNDGMGILKSLFGKA
uniref:Peptidase family M50 n=1 Tax=uncultured Thiotrichaceae bacterium TaxID=298394 RepID=A0A6S6U7Y5_9GAMM|nr:MAG: Peptidase family M50 [uncultured Thiotrichaceae bacterium]